MASAAKQPYMPLAGGATDGWSADESATATCFCGAVQLAFPTQGQGLIDTFLCHCSDCHKISASLFAANFTVADTHLRHLRGRDRLKTFSQAHTVAAGNTMTNYFCDTCGSLMYRVGSAFPGRSILRIGTVDDFGLHEDRLKPRTEQWTKYRVGWLGGVQGMRQVEGER